MSVTYKKGNLDLNWTVNDADKSSNDAGQLNADSSQKSSVSGSVSSSPQASPKVLHRTRGSKNNSSGNLSLNITITEEIIQDKCAEQFDGSILLDHEDAASRSSESNKSFDASFLRTPDSVSCRDLLKEKKSSDKKRKTSSWYNVLNPTYKSKTEDFKRLFKDLPESERLIVDYSCALQKDILVQGRLYISQNFICFYANIFRWETYLTIRCKDVTSMTKEKTALVIPNAIQICTDQEKHFFTSFGARDKAHLMLFRVWQNALLEQPMSPQELWAWIHYSYGDELGLTSDDDDYVAQPVADDEASKASHEALLSEGLRKSIASYELFGGPRSIDSPSDAFDTSPFLVADQISSSSPSLTSSTNLMGPIFNGVHVNGDIDDEAEEDNTDDEYFENEEQQSKPILNGLTSESEKIMSPISTTEEAPVQECNEDHVGDDGSKLNISTKSDDVLPKSVTDSSESDADLSEARCPCKSHEGRELINRILPFSVDQVLELMFSDSKFFSDFHASRKTTDIVHSPWTVQNGCKVRQVTYTLSLNMGMGIKCAHATETQTMHKSSQPNKMYCIEVDAINGGVPYGDNFYTHHTHCITRVSPEETRLRTTSEIRYKKNVWGLVKTFIEKNTWNGLEDFYRGFDQALEREANAHLQNNAPKAKKPKKTRRHTSSTKLGLDKSDPTSRLEENVQSSRKTAAPPGMHRDVPKPPSVDVLIPIVLIVLILLLILNALLYYKLWALEAHSSRYVFPNFLINPENLRSPKTNEDWVKLIQQQEALYQAEISKWREVIDTVVSVLRETEDSLLSLRQNMHPINFSVGNSDGPEATKS